MTDQSTDYKKIFDTVLKQLLLNGKNSPEIFQVKAPMLNEMSAGIDKTISGLYENLRNNNEIDPPSNKSGPKP